MRWADCAPDFETAHFLNGFPTPDGRFRFKPDWAAVGPDHARMPRLPDHLAVTDESGPEHPWRLVTAPARQFLNTDRKSKRLNSSHYCASRMPSSAVKKNNKKKQ